MLLPRSRQVNLSSSDEFTQGTCFFSVADATSIRTRVSIWFNVELLASDVLEQADGEGL